MGSRRKSSLSCEWEELPPLSSPSNYTVHSSRKSEGSLLLHGLIPEEPVGGGWLLHGSVGCWLQRDLVALHSSGSGARISALKSALSLTWSIPLSFLPPRVISDGETQGRLVILLAGDELVLVSDTLEVFAKYKYAACVLRPFHDDEFTSKSVT